MRLVTAGPRRLVRLPRRHRDDDDATARAGGSCSSGSSPSGPARSRCCSTPTFGATTQADDLDWVALLASCAAFDSYCQGVHRRSAARSDRRVPAGAPRVPVLGALLGRTDVRGRSKRSRRSRPAGRGRTSTGSSAGSRPRWRSPRWPSCCAGDLHAFLNGVLEQCAAMHAAVHDAYIDYPIEVAFES